MANYHPDSRYLNDFAAGTLSAGMAIMVKAHLEFCPECRNHVRQLEHLGGAIFASSENTETAEQNTTAVSDSLFDKLMKKIDSSETSPTTKPAYQKINADLPVVVDKLCKEKLDKLSWRKLGKSLNFSRLVTGDKNVELGFYHIKAGGKIPDHEHHCDEVTVVLKGSFSDLDGVYKKGDFIVRTNGEHHSPIATMDEDCLCLSALEKPIAFTGFYRLLNPFLKVNPA